MERGSLTQQTEVAKAIIKPHRKSKHQGRSVKVILQVIPEKKYFQGLSEELRGTMAGTLLHELIEKAYSEGMQGYELRLVGMTDSITQVMIEKGEDMPWENIEAILQKLKWDVLRDIQEKGGLRLDIQQCKEISDSLGLTSEPKPLTESE